MSDLVNQIMSLETNKERIQKFLDLGLNVRYGLSAQLTQLMYQLYQESSGDNTYNGRYNCGACQDTIYRKLNDFVTYGNNVGQPLINWEAEVQEEVKKTTKKKSNDNNNDETQSSTELG